MWVGGRTCYFLNACTVVLRKNGKDVGPPQTFARGEAFHFACLAQNEGDAVTIVSGTETAFE